jgi:hypothetical protein
VRALAAPRKPDQGPCLLIEPFLPTAATAAAALPQEHDEIASFHHHRPPRPPPLRTKPFVAINPSNLKRELSRFGSERTSGPR